MGRRTLLLIASILVAALGTALVWLYVQGADTRAQQGSELVPALFLVRDAQAGADANAAGLTVTKRVPPSVARDAITNPAELNGKTLKADAFAGQIVLRSMLGQPQAGRFPAGGSVAISINKPNQVPADLRIGDQVDVYALGARSSSRVVAKCLTVRSIGSVTQAPAANGTAAAGPAVPATVVGFDVDANTAKDLYDMVGANQEPALYDHNPDLGC